MTRVFGALGLEDGAGAVHFEEHYDTDIDDLWSAITDPDRLARWHGAVAGDLRVGGTFRRTVTPSGWEGSGHIDECDPPRRLRITFRQSDDAWQDGVEPYDEEVEATLSTVGAQTLLVLDVRGLPLDKVAYYGAGWQHNLEILDAYLRDQPPAGEDRFEELVPSYLEQAARLRDHDG